MEVMWLFVAGFGGLALGFSTHRKSSPSWELMAYMGPFLFFVFQVIGHMMIDSGLIYRFTFFLYGTPLFGLLSYSCGRGFAERRITSKITKERSTPDMWRYYASGKAHALSDPAELAQLIETGRIAPEVLVIGPGMHGWIRAKDAMPLLMRAPSGQQP
jgi:hypothetical protein